MTPIRRFLGVALPLCVLVATGASALESEPVPAPHGTVRLVTPLERAAPETEIVVAVLFTLDPGWHVYWANPGESGEPPRLRWTTPDHLAASEPDWPAPTRLVLGEIVNFGYEHELLLPVRMRATGAPAGAVSSLRLALDLSWLACRADECIPAKAVLSLTLPVTSDVAVMNPEWSRRFAQALARAPRPASATFVDAGDGSVIVSVTDPELAADANAHVEFFPRDAGIVDEGASPRVTFSRHGLEIAIAKAPSAPVELTQLTGILTLGTGAERRAYAVEAIASSTTVSATTAPLGIAAACAFALLGGLLLNLMPCVFPVLSLKVLGFAERAHGDPAKIRAHGWAFTIGVVLSFWVLAGSLLAIRAGGGELGWGFQLQSPIFVALLVYLLFAMGLSLVGVYEVGTSLSGAVGRVGTEEGLAGSFWTGAIATLVATPCTAPFMGPALGFALTQNAVTAMTIFTALGVGMASPYLVLSYFPALLSRMPRPGPWMERLRQAMAFPLFASALWLADVFAKQAGESALVRLLAGALVLTFALWLWGIAVRSGRSARGSKITALAAATIALTVGLGAARAPSPAPGSEIAHDGFWQPWSMSRVSELREQGRGVFVNFTAAWCLTCQVNERAIFARADVRDLFDRYRVAPLEADWTNEDPEIERALASFGRDGIPLYVFYPARADLAPIVLPQVPTRENLENAFSGKS